MGDRAERGWEDKGEEINGGGTVECECVCLLHKDVQNNKQIACGICSSLRDIFLFAGCLTKGRERVHMH